MRRMPPPCAWWHSDTGWHRLVTTWWLMMAPCLTCELTLSSRLSLSSRTSQTSWFLARKQTHKQRWELNKKQKYRQLDSFFAGFYQSVACPVGPGRAPASFYLASAAKLPPKCRQARVCLLRAFTSRVFSGCLFPAKCIRLCDPVFWQSKRKPKNCWHLQQNFVFCVIAITRLRTGNSFKTSSDEFTKSLIFPTAKKLHTKPHSQCYL